MAIQVNFSGALIRQLGAYIKTDLSAIRQINGVATGIPAVLGLAEAGVEEHAYVVRSHAEAVAIFRSGPLVDHLKTIFLGGAGEVVAVRIGAPSAAELSIELEDDATSPDTFTLDFSSIEKSRLSNNILVQLDEDDGKFIVTILQKNPDCTVTREIYEFPRVFNAPTVLYRRGNTLNFVQNWIIKQALDMLPQGASLQDRQDAVTSVLQDMLLPDDYVQFFDIGDEVPLGLILYEINVGGLFGYAASRLVRMTVNSEAASAVLDITSVFAPNPSTFFNTSSNSYEFTIVVTDTYTTEIIVEYNALMLSDYYALSGGDNGDDGTGFYGTGLVTTGANTAAMQSWVRGLQVLENEEVNFVQPAYRFHYGTTMGNTPEPGDRENFFSAVAGYVLAHVKLMSNVANRKRRTTILGFPAPHNDKYEKSMYLEKALGLMTALTADTDRSQDWIAPFYSTTITGNRTLLGGEFFATYMAGRHANVEPQVSQTFTPVGSLGAEFLYDWTYNEKDQLIIQRKSFVEKVKNSFGATLHRVHHNPTTWLGSVTEGYQEFILRRIDDYVSTYLFKNVEETFIGKPSYGARTSDQIRRYIESLLSNLVNKQIVAYRDVQVRANEDKTVYFVEFMVQPVTEIKFVLMTLKVSFDLE